MMSFRSLVFGALLALPFASRAQTVTYSHDTTAAQTHCQAMLARGGVTIDGIVDEAWAAAPWYPLNQRWLGPAYSAKDFSGRYKLLWNGTNLFLLAEIVDDTLIDIHPDPLDKYWDDDCLEIFLDPDASGGPHRNSHQAFAYHIGLDGKTVDYGLIGGPVLLDHVRSARKTTGNTSIWECAIAVYDSTFDDRKADNSASRQQLRTGQSMRFALAYCDNDRSPERENFIGSSPIAGKQKNLGYLTANVFGFLTLMQKHPVRAVVPDPNAIAPAGKSSSRKRGNGKQGL